TPVEIVENNVPLQVVRRELVPDSGGAGRHRGGLGQELAFQVVGERSLQVRVRPDKVRFPAPGICGGYPGAVGALLLDGQPIPPRTMQLEPGEQLVIRIPGGGGFGDPHERNPEALVADLEAGYVSEAAAERFYGGRPQAGK
ncbi:MAG: N-methylhydantoinase, partial [Thermomicrobiales bacterium]|nr:N-methylhydantoinase [Thermomicrobiales bacterium]